jgi:hypothetical protein
LEDIARWGSGALAGSLALAAVVLLWRRMAGALTVPLAWPALLGVGLVIALLLALGRFGWQIQFEHPRTIRSQPAFPIILSATGVVLALALTVPQSSWVGLTMLWGMLAIEEIAAWGPFARVKLPSVARMITTRQPTRPVHSPKAEQPDTCFAELPSEAPPGAEVTQQFARCRTSDGGELMTGWLRVPFAASQRNATVHLAFCPPFARTPRVSVEQMEGPVARIKMVQLLPYGARIDLKLGIQMDCPLDVLLQFSAQTEPRGTSRVESSEKVDDT